MITLTLARYVLFSIGNVKPLLQAGFPACWKKYTICDETWTQAIDYLEICGIIVGQILVGVIGDWLGRRFVPTHQPIKKALNANRCYADGVSSKMP